MLADIGASFFYTIAQKTKNRLWGKDLRYRAQFYYLFGRIVFRYFISPLYVTLDAAVDNIPGAAADLDTDWLHHAFTLFSAISRIYIHMPRPQAPRAVIGISRAFHKKPAVFAAKVFFFALELFCGHSLAARGRTPSAHIS